MVRENCPIIVKAINERIKAVEKELTDLLDLMTLMKFNISDEDITNTQINKKIDEEKKSIDKKETKLANQKKPKDPPSKSEDNIKKRYGNLLV